MVGVRMGVDDVTEFLVGNHARHFIDHRLAPAFGLSALENRDVVFEFNRESLVSLRDEIDAVTQLFGEFNGSILSAATAAATAATTACTLRRGRRSHELGNVFGICSGIGDVNAEETAAGPLLLDRHGHHHTIEVLVVAVDVFDEQVTGQVVLDPASATRSTRPSLLI